MLTALLILALTLAILGTIGVVGWVFDQGFFCWLIWGQEAVKACVYVIVAIVCLINEVNS